MSVTPSLIETPRMNFLITTAPTDNTIHLYIKQLQLYDVRAVIQVCEPNIYDPTPLEEAGLQVMNWNFPDGTTPPPRIVRKWLCFLKDLITNTRNTQPGKQPVVAVHCIAGLGRAPMMIAIAMIETGIPPVKAVEFIRERRPGALNSKQLQWLIRYKPISSNCTLL